MTIWLSHEEKERLVDLARHWHRSPSELIREAFAQFAPLSPPVTATGTDTEQVRALIRDALAESPLITATITATVAATLPAMVRQIVEEMAIEAIGLPVPATHGGVPARETPGKTPAQRKASRPRGTLRQRILEVLADHPEGLGAEQIRAYLKLPPGQSIGDTLQGMRRQHVVRTVGEKREMRYFIP
jgi:predicted transcriptional regulator